MNFSTVVPMLNSVDRLLNLLNLSLSTEFTEFENNNLGYQFTVPTVYVFAILCSIYYVEFC